jgi:hypothetical protein
MFALGRCVREAVVVDASSLGKEIDPPSTEWCQAMSWGGPLSGERSRRCASPGFGLRPSPAKNAGWPSGQCGSGRAIKRSIGSTRNGPAAGSFGCSRIRANYAGSRAALQRCRPGRCGTGVCPLERSEDRFIHPLWQRSYLVLIFSSLSRLAVMDSSTELPPLIHAPPSRRRDRRISSKGP